MEYSPGYPELVKRIFFLLEQMELNKSAKRTKLDCLQW